MFVIGFFVLRFVYFPIVVFKDTLPDAYEALPLAAGAQHWMILAMFPIAIAFTLLQMYWGLLIIQQVLKMLRGGGSDTQPSDEDDSSTEMIEKS